MRKLGILVGVTAALACLAAMLWPVLAWNGAANPEFRFHIVESGGTRPIQGARIRVIHDSRLRQLSEAEVAGMGPAQTTDATGSASIRVVCGAGGSSGLFGKTGRFVISHELRVEADGYRPLTAGLASVVGGRQWPLSRRLFEVELVLSRSP